MSEITSNTTLLEHLLDEASKCFSFLEKEFEFSVVTSERATHNLFSQIIYRNSSTEIEVYYEFGDGYLAIKSKNLENGLSRTIFSSNGPIQDRLELSPALDRASRKVRSMIEQKRI